MRDATIAQIYKQVEEDAAKARLIVHCYAHEYTMLRRFVTEWGRDTGVDGTYTYFGDGGVWTLTGVAVMVHLTPTESFRVAEPLVSWLLEQGWAATGQRDEVWEGSYTIGYRELTFEKRAPSPLYMTRSLEGPQPPAQLYCTVRLWPHRESQVCKRVAVGTQLTYKLVCEDHA